MEEGGMEKAKEVSKEVRSKKNAAIMADIK